ncbi:MAG: DNA polymerase III subunit delta' [Propionicimonas sp.]|uniref:DNA polymerase III subunit delta' n=1 Tax=Propionicimonas sp. TaxID=1955623 RepID=UPI002B21A809|nr:DNA polymerase III subunit delta' [Propionicimonas sp.]MEA4945822.1 DNA polymerase III subunit delta' [Propionicimonas sp.]MEA5116030.1 DNA polymerase III subunit delta' [Propionicimonas sp.]
MTTAAALASGVWSDLIGQERVISTLRRAVTGERHAMTHAWLFTGPPGSGRSNAARAFAAALQCEDGGCGHCRACRTALSGAHPDVTLVRTEQLSIGVDEIRDLVRRAAMTPTLGRFQVLVVEDADRVTERGADALLKSIEEPAARTVWLLCAPTADDVVATIRSRCRRIELSTPSEPAIAELLQRRDGVEPDLAAFAAHVSQGHIGRARALARSESARGRRREILGLPEKLTSLGACLSAAASVVQSAADEASSITTDLDAREKAELSEALGMGTKGAKPRNANAALRELEDQQKARAKRLQRDALDRVLTEFTSYYRDVLVLQTAAGAGLINTEFADPIRRLAGRSPASATVRRLDAILECRTALETNVAPLLAMESLMIGLGEGLE